MDAQQSFLQEAQALTKAGKVPKNYSVKKVITPLPSKQEKRALHAAEPAPAPAAAAARAFARPEAEDDDGYDPYSDRPPAPEAPFQEDPWR